MQKPWTSDYIQTTGKQYLGQLPKVKFNDVTDMKKMLVYNYLNSFMSSLYAPKFEKV